MSAHDPVRATVSNLTVLLVACVLYFSAATVEGTLDALSAVASGSPRLRLPENATVRDGASAIAAVLAHPDQRRALGTSVNTLKEERKAGSNVAGGESLQGVQASCAQNGSG